MSLLQQAGAEFLSLEDRTFKILNSQFLMMSFLHCKDSIFTQIWDMGVPLRDVGKEKDRETAEAEKGGGEREWFIERESMHMMVWFEHVD